MCEGRAARALEAAPDGAQDGENQRLDLAYTLQDSEHVYLAAVKARDVDDLALLRAARQDDRELDHRIANVEHASLLSVGNNVLARVNEHSVDGEAFVDLPLLESTEIRSLVTVGHSRELRVELVDLVLV